MMNFEYCSQLMKKLFAFIFILLAASTLLKAQLDEEQENSYGIKLALNYSTIGGKTPEYRGLTGLTGNIFLSKKLNDYFTLMFEPGYSSVSFREQSSDKRYNTHHLEAGLNFLLYPSLLSREFSFILGIRPAYLLAYNTQAIKDGSYQRLNASNNLNSTGALDFGAVFGISIAMSEFVNLELAYNYSTTNRTTATDVQGRASTVEIGLRVNAVSLKETFTRKERTLRDVVKDYSKGGLLVMLATPNQKEIDRLKMQANGAEEIKLIHDEIIARNRKIMREFRENYTVSKVYFFMDTSAYKIISGNLNNVFVDINMNVDTAQNPVLGNYFIASFSEDISNYTRKLHYGLFVFDEKMNPLNKPFNHPSNLVAAVLDGDPINYLRKRPNYIGAPYARVISKFNTRLVKYLN